MLLNEHFRCRPEIVAFSNDRFYGNTLTVIRDREDDHGLGPALIIREVHAPPAASYGKVNRAEAQALVADLSSAWKTTRYAGMSFGVLSLFREQVEHLELTIEREIPRALRERHRLICSTVDGFQGDERDVILYSWRYTDTRPPRGLRVHQRRRRRTAHQRRADPRPPSGDPLRLGPGRALPG